MNEERPVSLPPFRMDKLNQQLWHGSHAIELRRKTFLVLQHLVEHSGRLVTKEELLNAVWPGVYVSDTVLKVCIRELRRVLGERPAAPRFIETIHGRGYRFIGQKQGERFQEFVEEKQKANDKEQKEARGWRLGTSSTPLQAPSLKPQVSNLPAQPPELSTQDWPSLVSNTHHPTPILVGRETELAQLYYSLEKALNGERQFFFISGEPGIGKTALVDAFVEQATSAGNIWKARGQCIPYYGVGEPYSPVLDALSRVCREPGHEWLITHLNHYAPLWLAQTPLLLSPADRKSLQRELAGASRERMLREITEALEALTKETPLIVVLEDLHWSDSATLDLLSFLARRREPARLLVIGAYRPVEAIAKGHSLEEVRRELQMHRHCQELPLPLLTTNAIAQYLTQRFPDNIFSPSLTEWLHRHTSGNPLFLVNIVDNLVTRGVIVQHDDQWTLAPDFESAPFDIPTDLQAVIEQQSDQVSFEEAQVLQAASVAGMEFSTALAAAALNTDVGEVEKCCERLAQRQLFLRRHGLSEWPDGTLATRYGFLHTLYQRAWYTHVTPARRVQWHRKIGERLETAYGGPAYEVATELAVHFERGRDYRRAAQYLWQAAENASWRGAYQEVRAHLTKGIGLLKALSDSPESKQQELVLQTQLGLTMQNYKDLASSEAERVYIQAQALYQQGGEPLQLFHLLLGLSSIYQVRGEWQKAQGLAKQCLSLAEQLQNPALLTAAHSTLGIVLAFLGELTAARMHLEQGIALYDPRQHTPPPGGASFTTYNVMVCLSFMSSVLLGLGHPDQALKKLQEAFTLAQEQPHPYSLTWIAYLTAKIHLARQEWSLAQERAETVINLATKYGFTQWEAMGTVLRGAAAVEQGQLEEALGQIRQGLTAYQATGAEVEQPFYLALLARAYWKAGRFDEALTVLEEALSDVQHNEAKFLEVWLYLLKGELTLQKEAARSWKRRSEPSSLQSSSLKPHVSDEVRQEAEGYFQTAIDLARRRSAKWFELHAGMSLSRLWRHCGKKDEARQMLSGIYNWFTEGFDTIALKEAKVLLQELT